MRKFVARPLLALLLLPMQPAHAACNIVGGKAYGDCAGVTVRNGEKAPLNVRSSVFESDIVAGATVHSGGSLHLSGVSNGDIVVKRGGRLLVTGVVNGAVRNNGGVVEIEGIVAHLSSDGGTATIGGQVGSFSGTGPARSKKGAVLQGVPLERAARLPQPEPAARQQ
jgi:hypothetical protein